MHLGLEACLHRLHGDFRRGVFQAHPTQRIEQNANGKVTLKMTVQGLAEVARWVLYHAPYAKALEPKELRTMVAENAAKSAAAHKG